PLLVVGVFKDELDGVIIHSLYFAQRTPDGSVSEVVIPSQFVGEDHIFCSEGVAIGEVDVAAQLDFEHVVRDPASALRQPGLVLVGEGTVGKKCFIDQPQRAVGVIGIQGIPAGGLSPGSAAYNQCFIALGCPGCAAQHEQQDNSQHDPSCLHAS